jgi:hypothetical protein
MKAKNPPPPPRLDIVQPDAPAFGVDVLHAHLQEVLAAAADIQKQKGMRIALVIVAGSGVNRGLVANVPPVVAKTVLAEVVVQPFEPGQTSTVAARDPARR